MIERRLRTIILANKFCMSEPLVYQYLQFHGPRSQNCHLNLETYEQATDLSAFERGASRSLVISCHVAFAVKLVSTSLLHRAAFKAEAPLLSTQRQPGRGERTGWNEECVGLKRSVLYYTILYYFILHYIILVYFILYYYILFVLYYTILYNTILFDILFSSIL